MPISHATACTDHMYIASYIAIVREFSYEKGVTVLYRYIDVAPYIICNIKHVATYTCTHIL